MTQRITVEMTLQSHRRRVKDGQPGHVTGLESGGGSRELAHAKVAHRAGGVTEKGYEDPRSGRRHLDCPAVERARLEGRDGITRSQRTCSSRTRHSSTGPKISSTCLPKSIPILSASGRLGSYLPFSITLMVWRLTPSRSASSAWLQRRSARSTRSVFRIAVLLVAQSCQPQRGQPGQRHP